jgi:hypothetical protein
MGRALGGARAAVGAWQVRAIRIFCLISVIYLWGFTAAVVAVEMFLIFFIFS